MSLRTQDRTVINIIVDCGMTTEVLGASSVDMTELHGWRVSLTSDNFVVRQDKAF